MEEIRAANANSNVVVDPSHSIHDLEAGKELEKMGESITTWLLIRQLVEELDWGTKTVNLHTLNESQ